MVNENLMKNCKDLQITQSGDNLKDIEFYEELLF